MYEEDGRGLALVFIDGFGHRLDRMAEEGTSRGHSIS